MGLILAGILVAILLIGIIFAYTSRSSNPDASICIALAVIAIGSVFCGIGAGIREPVSGYEEPEVFSTTELVSLRTDTISEGMDKLFYVSISGTNSYTYYIEVDSTYASEAQKAYKSETISGKNVTIIEDDSSMDAKLVTYVRRGKKSFWTFATRTEKYEYVFYVPTGTIARNVSIG